MASVKAVLIIGGSGFIGSRLALGLRDGYKVFATYHSRRLVVPGVTYIPLDVSNRNWVKRIVYTARPDVVIYAAGPNDVDWAEDHTRDAERLHTGGPATVSNVSDILQPRFIYLSNSYVFDGNRGNYHENDIVLPGTALGKAKVGGENFIRGKALNHIIVRASPIIGRSNGLNPSFLDRLRMNLDQKSRVELSADELHSFCPADGFTQFIRRLVDSGPRNKTLHYGGLTKATFCDFARAFARRFGYDESLIFEAKRERGNSSESDGLDYSLNSSQVVEGLKIKPFLLEESLDLLEKELVPGL